MLFPDLIEVLDPVPHGAALNMAIDEVLLRHAALPILRVYRWARPAVSFGYFLKYEDVARAWPERELVRRWTGGGIVPHGDDLTYTLIVPRTSAMFRMTAAESYRAIHKCIADLCGSGVELAGAAAPKISEHCFENAARSDVLADGEKIAGAAQRRTKYAMLHQGSIQLASAAGALHHRLRAAFSAGADQREITGEELRDAAELAVEKYGSDAWMRRF